MELSTSLGIFIGIAAVTVGMVIKGANLEALLNPAAFLIIFVGTAACLLNGFALADLKKFPRLVALLFKKQELMQRTELLRLLLTMAQTARRDGLLALEPTLGEIKDPFLRNGLGMVIDGLDQELVADILLMDIQLMEKRHQSGALIFSQAGTYAPTLGVLGAVIGLIAALGNLSDIEKLGHSIAAAFVATLLGIFTGYVIWHPLANKLKMMSKREADLKKMMLEGIISILAGESPAAIEAKLSVFIPSGERGTGGEAVRNDA